MNNSCFLFPLHEPKFNYGQNLIKTYNTFYNDDHIYVVFSSELDSDKFRNLYPELKYRSIICNIDRFNIIITKKKFHGLKYIFDNTDFNFVGVIDCDTDFFKNCDYNKKFLDYYNRKKIFANYYVDSPEIKKIVVSTEKFFKNDDWKIIEQKLKNFELYFWFNDIPIYEKKLFQDFISYIDYNNNQDKIKWENFDFIMYAYYLLLINEFEIEILNIKTATSFIENQKNIKPIIFKELFTISKPMWIKHDIDHDAMTETFMHVHIDRK